MEGLIHGVFFFLILRYFSKALFEGLIHGGASLYRDIYLRFTVDGSSLIVGSKCTVLALFYFVFEANFPSTSPRRT